MRRRHASQKGLTGALAVALALAASFAVPAVADAEPTIKISSPTPGELVASPVTVSGTVEGELLELLEPITEVTVSVYPGGSPSGTATEAQATVFGTSWSTSVSVGQGQRTVVAEHAGASPGGPVIFYVEGPPYVTEEPSDTTVVAGEPAEFTAAAGGTPAPSVRWEVSSDGGKSWTLAGSTSDTLTFVATSEESGDAYRAVFENKDGSVATSAAHLTVDSPPHVTVNPFSQTVSAGGEAQFNAAASGNPEPSVHWEVSKDGGQSWAEYGGANSTTLSIGSVKESMNGWEFRAAFSNSVATVQSAPATLTVHEGPHITNSPSNQTVVAGNPVTFSASAEGTPAPSVHWEVSSDGGEHWSPAPAPNEESTLTFTASASESGNLYRAVFENSSGIAETASARLTVDSPPEVTQNPSSETVLAGGTAQFSAEAGGNPRPAVQWEYSTDGGVNWNEYGGANSTTLTIGSVKASMNGWELRASFSNFLATAHSAPATLTVNEGPHVTSSPHDQTVVAGQTVSFSASASGTPAPSVRWEVSTDNGANWSPAPPPNNETTLTFTASAAQSGNLYRAVFENSSGSEPTSAGRLTVEVPPTITANPQDVTLPAGERAEFTAAATGSPQPGVQWQYSANGGTSWTSISGANSPTYTTPPVSPSQSGDEYRAVFSNPAGEATSGAAVLTVHEGPHVTKQPEAKSVVAGSPASFTAEAAGFPAPTVHWEVSATSGATWAPDTTDAGNSADTITISPTTASENGFLYRATFTNLIGSVTTRAARLEILTKPTVTVTPTKVSIAPGLKAHFTAAVTGNPPPSLHWQYQAPGATSWTEQGSTSKELAIESKTTYNGIKLRAVAKNVVGTTESEPSELEVTNAPAVQVQPESGTVVVGDPAKFEAVATGNPPPSATWQTFQGGKWINVEGPGTSVHTQGTTEVRTTLTILHTTAADEGAAFRVMFENDKGTKETNAAFLTVETAPVVTQQPVSATVPPGDTVFFTASAAGTPAPTVQWQESANGSTWTPVAGAGTNTLTLPGVSPALNGRQYRAVFSNAVGSATSEAARLTVVAPAPASPAHGPPAATFSWLPTTPRIGESVSFVATASDASSAITGYAWSVQGGPFSAGSATFTTSFATPGPHPVSVRVGAADGQSTTVTKTIQVAPRPATLMQPFPVVRIAGTTTASGALVRLLSVRAPFGATVTIICRGRGCPLKKQVRIASSRHVRASYLVLLFPRFERSFPAGTVLQIRVYYPGEIGKYTSLRIRRGHLPTRSDACLDPTGLHPIGCPAP